MVAARHTSSSNSSTYTARRPSTQQQHCDTAPAAHLGSVRHNALCCGHSRHAESHTFLLPSSLPPLSSSIPPPSVSLFPPVFHSSLRSRCRRRQQSCCLCDEPGTRVSIAALPSRCTLQLRRSFLLLSGRRAHVYPCRDVPIWPSLVAYSRAIARPSPFLSSPFSPLCCSVLSTRSCCRSFLE